MSSHLETTENTWKYHLAVLIFFYLYCFLIYKKGPKKSRQYVKPEKIIRCTPVWHEAGLGVRQYGMKPILGVRQYGMKPTKYPKVFEPGVGTIQGVKATLHVKPNVTPKFRKDRLVPYALHDQLQAEYH